MGSRLWRIFRHKRNLGGMALVSLNIVRDSGKCIFSFLPFSKLILWHNDNGNDCATWSIFLARFGSSVTWSPLPSRLYSASNWFSNSVLGMWRGTAERAWHLLIELVFRLKNKLLVIIMRQPHCVVQTSQTLAQLERFSNVTPDVMASFHLPDTH